MSARIVILARHFPPLVSGGARRPYLLASELVERGHEVCVVAPEKVVDSPFEMVAVPHHGELAIERSAGRPTRRPVRDFLRRNLALPDPDIRWALRAADAVGELTVDDWLITSSPPESMHVAGARLKRKYGCRWLADFRDSWLKTPLRAELQGRPVRRAIERRIARAALRKADAITATTPDILQEAQLLSACERGAVVGHFSDSADNPAQLPSQTVNIVHTGSFTLSDRHRHIEPVLEAFEKADRDDLRLYLIGRLTDEEVNAISRSARHTQIEHLGACDRASAMGYQAGGDALLLAASPQSPHIPGKLAEYLTTDNPILAIGGGRWVNTDTINHASSTEELGACMARLSKTESLIGAQRVSPHTTSPAAAAQQFLELMNLR